MPRVTVKRLSTVGDRTSAIELETPDDFEAYPGQFVLVRAIIDGEEETGYYTISSPTVNETFEITVAADPDGTLGPWLTDRHIDDEVEIEGPYGNIQYTGDGDALVFAGGPGIGPAVGIGELARSADQNVTIVYGGSEPPHRERLDALESNGASVVITEDMETVSESLDFSATVYVFGFQGFVNDVKAALTDRGVDVSEVEIESFGPA